MRGRCTMKALGKSGGFQVCCVVCKIILPWLPLHMSSVKAYITDCSKSLRSEGYSFVLGTGLLTRAQ